jgi:hypothetical protein
VQGHEPRWLASDPDSFFAGTTGPLATRAIPEFGLHDDLIWIKFFPDPATTLVRIDLAACACLPNNEEVRHGP